MNDELLRLADEIQMQWNACDIQRGDVEDWCAKLRALAAREQPAQVAVSWQCQTADHRWEYISKDSYDYAIESGSIIVRALYAAPPPAAPDGWRAIESAPDMPNRDDAPCSYGGSPIPPMNYSEQVLVVIAPHNGVRLDSIVRMDGSEKVFGKVYGERITHWMPIPPPPKESDR